MAEKEYIEREAAKNIFDPPLRDPESLDFWEWLQSEIEAIPAADVEEVRHGRWEYEQLTVMYGNPYGCYRCSACGDASPHISNFCPNCGAKMEGEADEQ